MKKTLLLATVALALASCSPFYQVIETKPSQAQSVDENAKFENQDIRITYNFWNADHYMYFEVFNKTNQPLYLDLDRSHLIINGESIDYFQNSSSEASFKLIQSSLSYTGQASSVERKVSYSMKKVVEIPPKSYTWISGKTIIPARIIDCDIKTLKGKMVSKSYTPETSPLTFRNYITYSSSPELTNPKVADNSFYAETVRLMSAGTFKGKTIKLKNCPNDSYSVQANEYPYKKPGNLYFEIKP